MKPCSAYTKGGPNALFPISPTATASTTPTCNSSPTSSTQRPLANSSTGRSAPCQDQDCECNRANAPSTGKPPHLTPTVNSSPAGAPVQQRAILPSTLRHRDQLARRALEEYLLFTRMKLLGGKIDNGPDE
ncbi:hypothetical protein AGDE_13127 [Angomonas deanei]|uniref:Uncharacterized protein n=1 Tax=Angomonas deanei TaxID=59799 RepID=A0A7G2CHQ9_9TRYP|nr:hypothetical protein AGDE_13127 [Angomonas deanei]CAD2218597.1 hypothetical protein, conserved [Angomonas deanei]|eukprot:EPY22774.1 hypothetical protein AGDE_13127 [Angomonas deanei]